MCPPGWLGWRHIHGGTGPGPLLPAPGEGGGSNPSPSSLPRERGASPLPGKRGDGESHPGGTHSPVAGQLSGSISSTGSGSLPSDGRERWNVPPPKVRRHARKAHGDFCSPGSTGAHSRLSLTRPGEHKGCGWKAFGFPQSQEIVWFSFSGGFFSETGKYR